MILTPCGAKDSDWFHFEFILGLNEDLLPVVANTKATISPNSSLKELGKVPTRYNGRREVSGFMGWPEHCATDKEVAQWSAEGDYGICVITREVRGLDVDITDPVLAQKVQAFIADHLGYALPKRWRANSSKFLHPFRLVGEFGKRVIKVGVTDKIEILMTGEQFVACGTHPSGARIEWEGGLPHTIPELTVGQFEALFQSLQAKFGVEDATISTLTQKGDGKHLDMTDPAVAYMVEKGLILGERKGKLIVACPNEAEHSNDTTGTDSTVYIPAGINGLSDPGFCCKHAHCEGLNFKGYYEAIGYEEDMGFTAESDPPTGTTKPGVFTAADLMDAEFKELKWCVPDILPEGTYLLSAKPKVGKSWMALQFALAIAKGGLALGRQVESGSVLVLALEDNNRRLKSRLDKLGAFDFTDRAILEKMHVHTEWPRVHQGGAAKIEQWLIANPDARLVVIDTLAMFRPTTAGRASAYEQDYLAMAPIKALSDKYSVTVLVVTHNRKMAADDALDTISGTMGLSGGCDGALVIERVRSSPDATLHLVGRDIENDGAFAIQFEKSNCTWQMIGNAGEVSRSKTQGEILKVFTDAGRVLAVKEVVAATGKNAATVRGVLRQLLGSGKLRDEGWGKYCLPTVGCEAVEDEEDPVFV